MLPDPPHASRKPSGVAVLEENRELPGPARGRDCTKIAELLADERCSQVVLVFLETTGQPVAEEGLAMGEQGTRGATHIVERGRGEAEGGGPGG